MALSPRGSEGSRGARRASRCPKGIEVPEGHRGARRASRGPKGRLGRLEGPLRDGPEGPCQGPYSVSDLLITNFSNNSPAKRRRVLPPGGRPLGPQQSLITLRHGNITSFIILNVIKGETT